MSKQEDFGRPEKPLEKTREIDNEARISKKAEMKRKFNRNQKGITLWDIQLSSLIFLVTPKFLKKYSLYSYYAMVLIFTSKLRDPPPLQQYNPSHQNKNPPHSITFLKFLTPSLKLDRGACDAYAVIFWGFTFYLLKGFEKSWRFNSWIVELLFLHSK